MNRKGKKKNFKSKNRTQNARAQHHPKTRFLEVPSQRLGQGEAALTHDGVLGLEQRSPLAQPHGPAHLPRIVFWHVYDLEMYKTQPGITKLCFR